MATPETAPNGERDPSDGSVPAPPLTTADVAVVGVAVVVGLVLRVAAASDLWLDEALSANIAERPLSELVDALRRDGHPPLYYALLHGWMRVVGDGDLAVRAMSGLAAAASLPLFWRAAARRRGRAAGWATVAIASVTPYATRYATEARMYALVMLFVALGWWYLDRLLDGEGGWPAAVGLWAAASMALWSHYWSVWIVAVVGLAVLVAAWRGEGLRRRGALRAGIALFLAGVSFLPWVPVLLDQLAHTGTPWGAPQRPTMSVSIALIDFAGGSVVTEAVLGVVVLTVLVAFGLTARPRGDAEVVLDLRTVPWIRTELLVTVAALGVGLCVAWATDATFASRYAAFAFPVVAVAAGIGVVGVPRGWARTGVMLVALAVLGGAAVLGAADQRTQGGEVADAISRLAGPDDLIIACPDQLGPSLSRGLSPERRAETYPDRGDPRFVDWRDYAERNAAADPEAFARDVLADAEVDSIWLVWMSGYATFDDDCEVLRNTLAAVRAPTTVITARPGEVFEPMWAESFPPVG